MIVQIPKLKDGRRGFRCTGSVNFNDGTIFTNGEAGIFWIDLKGSVRKYVRSFQTIHTFAYDLEDMEGQHD